MLDDIQCVRDQNRAAGHVHDPVEKTARVGFKGPSMDARCISEGIFFEEPLAGAQKYGEEKYGKKQPLGNRDAEGFPSGLEAKEEAGGNAEQVDNRQVLQVEGVQYGNKEICDKDGKKDG